ncbi:DNA polymerase III subunit gamma and tau, partial [Streptomyces sp. NPDC059002]
AAPSAEGRPGGWPTASAPGSGPAAAPAPAAAPETPRPGGWPTAASAGSGAPAPQSAPQPAAPAHQAPAAQAPAPMAAAPAGGPDPRTLWPNILEAVKNRRRFTWILLSQNAQVTGFDGTTLQIGFVNAGARDNFASSGSEDVLRQALSELFGVQWKVEAIVDPSGGSAPPPAAGNFGGAPVAQRPAAPQQPTPPPAAPAPQAPPPSAPAPAQDPAPRSAPAPEHVSPEDDIPEDDDPDLVESALSGHDLIVRELGATVIDEYPNE